MIKKTYRRGDTIFGLWKIIQGMYYVGQVRRSVVRLLQRSRWQVTVVRMGMIMVEIIRVGILWFCHGGRNRWDMFANSLE